MSLMFLLKFIACVIICNDVAECQCYLDSDISIYQSGYPHNDDNQIFQLYQESNNQCLASNTVISASIIDESVSKGITCSRKDSTATDGTWSLDGTAVNCSNTGPVRCTRQQPGSVTLFTAGPYSSSGDDKAVPEGTCTCCIEGLCISIRLLQFASVGSMYPFSKRGDSELESCTIIPPSDITAIPQTYMVQMVTSVFPPSRLVSFIDCTGASCGNDVTLGKSYYTLVNLTAEQYQYTTPVTWNAVSTSDTEHKYSCKMKFGGLKEDGDGDVMEGSKIYTSTSSSSAPSSVSHELMNATAIKISWTISGNVRGFVINITSNG